MGWKIEKSFLVSAVDLVVMINCISVIYSDLPGCPKTFWALFVSGGWSLLWVLSGPILLEAATMVCTTR